MTRQELIEWIDNLPTQTLTDELKDDIIDNIIDAMGNESLESEEMGRLLVIKDIEDALNKLK